MQTEPITDRVKKQHIADNYYCQSDYQHISTILPLGKEVKPKLKYPWYKKEWTETKKPC